MIKKLQHVFALSEKGARDLVKAVVWCFVCNISLMLPVGAVMFAMQHLLAVLGGASSGTDGFWVYTGLGIAVLILLFVLHWFQYASLYLATYRESASRRVSLAETLRRLPLSFFVIGICMFCFNWRMALAVLWVVPVAVLLTAGSKRIQDAFGSRSILNKRAVSDCIQEGLETIRDIKACSREERYMSQLDEKLAAMESGCIRSELATGVFVCSAQAFLRAGLATTVLTGSALMLSGDIGFLYFLGFLFAAAARMCSAT